MYYLGNTRQIISTVCREYHSKWVILYIKGIVLDYLLWCNKSFIRRTNHCVAGARGAWFRCIFTCSRAALIHIVFPEIIENECFCQYFFNFLWPLKLMFIISIIIVFSSEFQFCRFFVVLLPFQCPAEYFGLSQYEVTSLIISSIFF